MQGRDWLHAPEGGGGHGGTSHDARGDTHAHVLGRDTRHDTDKQTADTSVHAVLLEADAGLSSSIDTQKPQSANRQLTMMYVLTATYSPVAKMPPTAAKTSYNNKSMSRQHSPPPHAIEEAISTYRAATNDLHLARELGQLGAYSTDI